jgi:tRNA dimethylallyltransferase
LADLLLELARRDPATFERIDRFNPRRVIRAVEVIRLSGKPFSVQRAAGRPSPGLPAPSFIRFLGFNRQAADLHARISARVDEMFRAGLVAETEMLVGRGLEQNRAAMQAIGYRQTVEFLRGERSLPETIELVKLRTRQFAKRQMTWFRRQASLTWMTLSPGDSAALTAAEILGRRL